MTTPTTNPPSAGPGAGPMTGPRQTRGGKILRACVVQGGKVVEERRLDPREDLSIGSGPKNTFVVADPSLPKSHTLFAWNGTHYELVFSDTMRGKLDAAGAASEDLADLMSQGKAKKKGKDFALVINENHRGKIIIGESTVIFQFVVPPPAPAKPELPVAAKFSVLKSLDWPFVIILAIAIIIEFPGVVYLHFVEIPGEPTLEDLKANQRLASLIIPDYKPEEKKADAAADKGKAADAKKEASKAKKTESAGSEEDNAKAAAARRANIRSKIAGKGILAILGTAGDGSSGAVADVFGQGGLGGDLDGAFEGIAGVGLATGAGAHTTRGGGSGEAASIGGLATSGGGDVGLSGKTERRVGAVKAAAPEVDGALDSAEIARVVRSRMRSIQDCYEKELKRDPSLAGKIEIEFTIGAEGRVDEASVASNGMGSDAVGECIVSRIRSWRFPKPDGGSVTVNYPFIFTASG